MGPLELFARPFLLLLIFHKEILLGVVRFCNFKRTSTKTRNRKSIKKEKENMVLIRKVSYLSLRFSFIHLTPQTAIRFTD